jgi:hypothetical protein
MAGLFVGVLHDVGQHEPFLEEGPQHHLVIARPPPHLREFPVQRVLELLELRIELAVYVPHLAFEVESEDEVDVLIEVQFYIGISPLQPRNLGYQFLYQQHFGQILAYFCRSF